MKATVDRTKKMQTRCLVADWDPRPDYKLGSRDIEGKLTYLGSKVWRNPRIESVDKDIPVPGPEDILVEVAKRIPAYLRFAKILQSSFQEDGCHDS